MTSFMTIHNADFPMEARSGPPAQVPHSLAATPSPLAAHSGPPAQFPQTPSPVARPIAVQNSLTVAMINPEILHFQNPRFVEFGGVAQGSPRQSFALPVLISPTASPTDQTLFEEPQDPTKKHYLPSYGIAATASGGGPVKWVSLAPSANGFQLIVHLAEVTDPLVAKNNLRVDAPARYLLTANLQGRVANWDFQSASTEGATLKLTLVLPDFASRDSVYQAMTDPAAQAKLIIRRSLALALPVPPVPSMQMPAQPGYRQLTTAIDSTIPFTFDKDLDKNVFQQLQGLGGALPPWQIVRVSWNGRPYAYYQDRSQPRNIYFLPDAFKIGRQPKPPHYPSLIISTNGVDLASLTLTLSYLSQPVWDPNRLAAAAKALQEQLSLDAPPLFALFEASSTNTTLSLKLPSDDPSASPGLVPQRGAIIDIAAGIQGSVTLKLPQFRQAYDALFDEVSEFLSGQVAVTIDTDVETTPFTARASDFAGAIFDINTEIDAHSNRVVAVLQNAIESTIHVDNLFAVLGRGGNTLPNSVEQISPPLPADLPPARFGSSPAPAGSVTVTLQPAPDQLVDSSCTVLFDFGQTHVVPDSKAIWHAILQNQVVGPVARPITLKLVAALLTTAPAPVSSGAPSSSIMAVQVVFENGQTANFDASMSADVAGFLNQKISLAVPVEAYVLQEGGSDTYRYRVDLITEGSTKTGDWASDNRDVLFLSVD